MAYQAPWSMGFSRHKYWSGMPFPSPGDLPNPEIEPRSPPLQADGLLSEAPRKFLKHRKHGKLVVIPRAQTLKVVHVYGLWILGSQ